MIDSESRRNQHTGTNSTDTYSFTFKIDSSADLIVTEKDTDDVETTLTLTTDYTVDGVGDAAGGTITLVAGNLATSHILVIKGDTPRTQETDIRNQGPYLPEVIEDQFDKLTNIDIEQQETINRAVVLSPTTSTADFDPVLPPSIVGASGKVPLTNATGDAWADPVDWPTGDEVNAAQGYSLAAAAAQAAAEAAQALAETAQTNAETAETNAETAETNAEAAQAAAEAAQAAAETAAQSVIWADVVFLTFADSPYTIGVGDYGTLYAVDTTGGNVAITLPAIAGLDLSIAWSIGVKKTDSSGNTVTITRASTDTIDGATSKTLDVQNQYSVLVPDTDSTPDQWTALDGGSGNSVTAASTFGTDNRLVRTDGVGRGAQATGITVDDSDNTTIPGTLTVQGATIAAASATTVTLGTTNSNTTASIASGSGTNTVTIGGASTTTTSTGQFNHDNLRLDGNTISSTNTNGSVTITPNGTGQLLLQSGSAANPAISFTADSTSGIWYNPAYSIVFSAGGANMYNLNNSQLEVLGGRKVLFFRSDNVQYVGVDANDSMTASYNIVLPTAQGSSGQVMVNDGSGNLSWQSMSGGGGSLQWVESGNSPTPAVENNNNVYLFESGLAQELYAAVRIPSTYTAGKQIYLRIPYYSPDSSNTALLSTVAYLIRTGTDAISSTTNSRTSTNSATTLTSADRLLTHTCDLTDSSGQVNSVACAAGDMLIVKLTRGTDTATSDIRALVYGAEVSFNG
jgi:hypothetical protein